MSTSRALILFVLATVTVAARASAQEPAPVRPQVVRFGDEARESRSVARLLGATDARAEPNDAGELIAHLPPGKLVTRLAARGDALLVELDDPEGTSSQIVGWVPRMALHASSTIVRFSPDAPYPVPQIAPPAYHFESHPRWGLVIGGALLFANAYAISAWASTQERDKSGFVPIAGPFIVASNIPSDAWFSGFSVAIEVILGLGQVAGVAMLVGGLTNPRTDLVHDKPPRAQLKLTPMTFAQGGYGMGLAGRF